MCAIDGFKSYDAQLNLDADTFSSKGISFARNKKGLYSMKGSFHKYFNGGLHNANDYFLSDFKNTLNELFEETGLNPEITTINGFEFGVNIKLPFSPNRALQRLILHKSSSGTQKSYYKEFEYKNYALKVYNKSELTKIEPYQAGDILRVEIKIYRMEHLKKVMTYKRLSDLLNVEVWERLETVLIETINECLIIDFSEAEEANLNDKERIKYLQYINPMYWVNLHEDRRKYSREREYCGEFIKIHSKSTLKTDILNLVSAKCRELRDEEKTNSITKMWDKLPVSQDKSQAEKCDKLTVLETSNKTEKCDKLTVLEDEEKTAKCDKLTIKIKEQFVAFDPAETGDLKLCKGCGKILPNPKKNQVFCGGSKVGKKEAHKCRNKDSNIRNNTKRAIRKVLSIPLLFDLSETITPNKLKYWDAI